MASFFNGSTWQIYNMKDAPQGESVMSPQSPSPDMASAAESGGKEARSEWLAVGKMLGMRAVYQTVGVLKTEIVASTGDEIFQNKVNNIITGVQLGTMIKMTKGVGALLMVGQAAVEAVVHYRENTRINREQAYQRELADARIITNNSAYYGG